MSSILAYTGFLSNIAPTLISRQTVSPAEYPRVALVCQPELAPLFY